MAVKELYIDPHAIQMVEVDGAWNIPTVVFYKPDGGVLIGNSALAEASDPKLTNEDFKIDLGRYAPGIKGKRRYATAAGDKTAMQLADDFLYELQKVARQWLLAHGIKECKKIVVAEPLSMHTEEVSPEWLPNYRSTIRQLLEHKKERFSSRHAGRFRIAHGKPPYTSFATYVGPHPFSDAEALVVNMERGEGLSLTPLVFWYHCQSHRDHENGHCFFFDKMKDEGREVAISYKAAGFPCHLEITGAREEMAPLVETSVPLLLRTHNFDCSGR